MKDIKVLTEETFAQSKPFLFVVSQWVDLLKAGHGDMEFSFGNQALVTYAHNIEQEILGAIVWNYDNTRRVANELFSVVDNAHRKKGIYTLILGEVTRRAKLKGAVAFYSGVALENDTMLSVMSKTERSPTWYRIKKSLR